MQEMQRLRTYESAKADAVAKILGEEKNLDLLDLKQHQTPEDKRINAFRGPSHLCQLCLVVWT